MRLVDADAVKEALRNRIGENIDECINNVPTACDIEQIRAEVADTFIKHGLGNTEICFDILQIIDRKGEQHDR